MLIKQICQKNVIFVTIGFKYERYLCNDCHDLMQKAMILFMLKEMLTEFIFGI